MSEPYRRAAHPSSACRHLLPQGEKGDTRQGGDTALFLLPLWEKVDRPKAETDEGWAADAALSIVSNTYPPEMMSWAMRVMKAFMLEPMKGSVSSSGTKINFCS